MRRNSHVYVDCHVTAMPACSLQSERSTCGLHLFLIWNCTLLCMCDVINKKTAWKHIAAGDANMQKKTQESNFDREIKRNCQRNFVVCVDSFHKTPLVNFSSPLKTRCLWDGLKGWNGHLDGGVVTNVGEILEPIVTSQRLISMTGCLTICH